ncbi:MAG: RNA-binding protein [Cyanobacteria bacterium P01_F01_bin.86]
MSVYVGNLSYSVTQDDLTEVFGEYGTVKRIHLPTDRETGRMRGFAFVEMETDAEEEAAIEALDGAEWMGRDLKVNKAKPRENRSSSGGGWGNRGGSRRY